MFIWPETRESRTIARQAIIDEHKAKVYSIPDSHHSLDEAFESGILGEDAYLTEKSLLKAERERLGNLRWDWDRGK